MGDYQECGGQLDQMAPLSKNQKEAYRISYDFPDNWEYTGIIKPEKLITWKYGWSQFHLLLKFVSLS